MGPKKTIVGLLGFNPLWGELGRTAGGTLYTFFLDAFFYIFSVVEKREQARSLLLLDEKISFITELQIFKT